MDSSSPIFLNASFLGLSEVNLGCLVLDPTSPNEDFCPREPSKFTADEINTRSVEGFSHLLQEGRHSGLRTRLTSLLSGTTARQGTSLTEIIAPKSTIRSLRHPMAHFRKMCQDETIKEWIEDANNISSVYLLSGLATVTEANIHYKRTKAREYGGSLSVPVTSIVTQGVGALLPVGGDILDPGVDISTGRYSNASSSLFLPGEWVIGVQYRKIKIKRFRSNAVDTARLDGVVWKMLGQEREGAQDMLEAELQECVNLNDLGLDDGSTDNTVEGGGFIFIDEIE
jgi:hypothetical protein